MITHAAREQVEKLVELIYEWLDDGKYGNIQVNFSGGGITNLNVSESLKLENIEKD